MTLRLALAISLALLSGCASPEQTAAVDNDRCASYGFTPGTDAYAQCRMQLDSDRRTRRRAAIDSIGSTPMVAPGVSTTRRTCTSTPGVGTVTTVCE